MQSQISETKLCPNNPIDCQLCEYNVGKGIKSEFSGMCLYDRGEYGCYNCGLSGLKIDDSHCFRCGIPFVS